MKQERIILYTLENCIYCNVLKNKLEKENIKYLEVIIDNGTEYNNKLGNTIEQFYQTESYPIVEIKSNNSKKRYSFISKTNLALRENIIIFKTIDELLIQLKEKLYEV